MPVYNVTDPDTGRTLRLEGDSPPTEAELKEIFSPENLRRIYAQGAQPPVNVRPAVKPMAGAPIMGREGQTHNDIITEHNLPATNVDQRGFVDAQGKFLNREQAAAATRLPTRTEPGRLHSTDLPETIRRAGPSTVSGFATAAGGPRAPVASLAETLVEPKEALLTPRITAPQLTVKETDSPAMVVGKEAWNLAKGIPEFMSSTAGLLSMVAAAGAPVATGAVFTGTMLEDLGKQLLATYRNWGQLTRNEKIKAVTDIVGTGAMAGLAGRATLKELAPRTTAALENVTQTTQKGVTDAQRIRETETLHGDVQPPGGPPGGPGQVPPAVSGQGIPPRGPGPEVPEKPPVPPQTGISAGPGAAAPGDVPAAPRQAVAVGGEIENAPPERRPLGGVSAISVGLNQAREALSNIGAALKGFAGHTLPKTTAANREVGEAGARYLSSRIAAHPLAATFSAKALQGTGVDPIKLGAALTEDNLRSVRESFRAEATRLLAEGKPGEAAEMTRKADDVNTVVGSRGSPFANEDAYQDFLADPMTRAAVNQHLQLWQEVIDPQYRAAQGLDPDVELPSRGLQTGARINLKAVRPDAPATRPVTGSASSGLTATFKRKSPFGRAAKGTGQAYDIDYSSIIRNTFERQLEIANKNAFDKMLQERGLALVDKPGRTDVSLGGKPAVAFPLQRKVVVTTGEGKTQSFSQTRNIYVRSDLAGEYRAAANVDPKAHLPIVTPIMNLLNRAALSGLTDFTVHGSNQLTGLFNRPVSGKLLTDTLASVIPGRPDAAAAVVKSIMKGLRNNQEQLAELASIGALRQPHEYGPIARWLKPGAWLQRFDRTTRLLLDDTFKSLVSEGLVPDTQTARREYVNQIGQYNRRAQGYFMRLARDTGFGPFATAGRAFNTLGVKMATLSPGAPAANAFAAAALRANVLAKWIGTAATVATLNYLFTGKLLGRPGTKLGDVDTGRNDASGKQLSLPVASLLGVGRALRVTGIKGAIEAKRLGLTNADALQAASRDIINSWTGPFAGPPVKFATTAATGYAPAVDVGRVSRVVPPGQSQRLENVKEAISQASPLWQSFVKYREGKSTHEVLASQLPRFTLQPGKTESMVAQYPKIVSLAQGAAFIDDMIHQARQLPKPQRAAFVRQQVARLPIAQRPHALKEVIRRKVYTN